MIKKLLLTILLILIAISINSKKYFVYGNTGYIPSDDEIAPLDVIVTGDKALSDINVRIFQPFLSEMDETTSSIIDLPTNIVSDAQCPVAFVKTLQITYGALIKTIRTYNKPISLEDIQSLGPNQIIVFSGHGTWMGPTIHSTILTGRLFDENAYENNPLYRQDVDEGRIVSDVGNEAITTRYIEKYCPDLNNSFVFLGICQGAYHMDDPLDEYKDQSLVNAFLSKGASAVFAYSETTDMRYSNVMTYTILNNIAVGKTLSDSLQQAKNIYGDHDPSIVESTPLIFSTSSANDFSINSVFNNNAPIKKDYVYDGFEKIGVTSGVGYTLSGDLAKTEVGNYTVTATLNDGFKWPDGTIDSKTINWSISKANICENDLMPNNIEIKYDGEYHDLMTIRNKELGTYYFRLKGDSIYSTIIPKAKNVKDYEIEWYFVGDENAENKGSDSSPIIYTTSIIKGDRHDNEAKLDNYYYGKELPSPYLSEDIEEGTKVEYYYFSLDDLYHDYKWENMTSTTLIPGTYYIYAKIEETENYNSKIVFDSEFKVLEYTPISDYIIPNTGID